jgi:hypothetical protein
MSRVSPTKVYSMEIMRCQKEHRAEDVMSLAASAAAELLRQVAIAAAANFIRRDSLIT